MQARYGISRLPLYTLYVARLGLGVLFLWSGLTKISSPYDFLSNIYSYELTSPDVGVFLAITLPWLELLLGIGLLGGVCIGGSLLISALLSVLFACAQYSAIRRGLKISCGCFGNIAAQDMASYGTLLRLGLMFVVSVVGYTGWLMSSKRSPSKQTQESTSRSAQASMT